MNDDLPQVPIGQSRDSALLPEALRAFGAIGGRDGLWETLRGDGIEEVLLIAPNPQRAADGMVRRANLSGGQDNISVTIVSASPVGVAFE